VNLRTLCAATTAALSLALAPAAIAKPKATLPDNLSVCNTASQNWQGGDLVVDESDPQGALRYEDELRPKKRNGAGLYNAALHSRALAVCGDGSTGGDTPGGGGDDGVGDGGTGGDWGGTGL
jgi:hypothetical protein